MPRLAILFATHRYQHLLGILEYFRAAIAACPELDITIYPISFVWEIEKLQATQPHIWEAAQGDDIEWIVLPHVRLDWHAIMFLFNGGLSHLQAIGFDGWIWQGQDDNVYPAHTFRAFYEGIQHGAKVVLCHQKRGQWCEGLQHGCSDLIAAKENIKVGHISLEQYAVHSSLHYLYPYLNSACGDGLLMEQLYAIAPQEFWILPTDYPQYWLPYNALEMGRWDMGELHRLLGK
jgi:hypothetical protein